MICQFVPSETSVAHAPSVAGKIAVPAASPVLGTTLLDAETTVWAVITLIVNSRPVHEDAAGRVTVQVEPLFTINQFSVSANVKSLVFVTGAPRPKEPAISSLFTGLVPIPTFPSFEMRRRKVLLVPKNSELFEEPQT